jgi:hypothetical protein
MGVRFWLPPGNYARCGMHPSLAWATKVYAVASESRGQGGRAAQGGWEGYQPNFARRADFSIIYYIINVRFAPPRGGGGLLYETRRWASFVQSARALMRIERGRSRRQAAPGMLWGRSA